MAKKRKIRAEFRKNRSSRTRQTNLTRQYDSEQLKEDSHIRGERISGKGDLTRRRTIMAEDSKEGGTADDGIQLAVDLEKCLPGRVLRVHGLYSIVEDASGELYKCATRRILKTLSTDQRHVVASGDQVFFRPVENSPIKEGFIERVEPRRTIIARDVRGRKHILVTNVDQVAIVVSAAEPRLKPNLIDRMIAAAEQSRVRPIICINKIDLIELPELQPLIGVFSQMGYEVLLTSVKNGDGIDRLRQHLHGRATVIAGQSGVGKSSLLNAIDPTLDLRVQEVSRENEKGKHTTTGAQLIPLSCGGYVVDTPGIRRFQLWDVIPEEVEGYFRDIRPWINLCRFPNCTHTHESDCAVKNAVADGRLDERRYESYCKLHAGEME